MYIDHDSNERISILEISQDESYILTEALIRFATNPDFPAEDREKAKVIAYQINQEHENTKHADE